MFENSVKNLSIFSPLDSHFNLDKNSTDYLTSTQEKTLYSTTRSILHSTLAESSTTSSEDIVSETSVTIVNNDVTSERTSSDTITTQSTTEEQVFPYVSEITTEAITHTMTAQIITDGASIETTTFEESTTLVSVRTTSITTTELETVTTEVISFVLRTQKHMTTSVVN